MKILQLLFFLCLPFNWLIGQVSDDTIKLLVSKDSVSFYSFNKKGVSEYTVLESKKLSKKYIEYTKPFPKELKHVELPEDMKRVLGKEAYFYKMVYTGVYDSAYYNSKLKIASSIPRYLMEFVMVFFVISIVIIVAFTGNGLDTLFSTLAIFGIAALRLLPVVSALSNTLIFLRFSSDSVSRLFDDVQKSKKSKKKGSKDIL